LYWCGSCNCAVLLLLLLLIIIVVVVVVIVVVDIVATVVFRLICRFSGSVISCVIFQSCIPGHSPRPLKAYCVHLWYIMRLTATCGSGRLPYLVYRQQQKYLTVVANCLRGLAVSCRPRQRAGRRCRRRCGSWWGRGRQWTDGRSAWLSARRRCPADWSPRRRWAAIRAATGWTWSRSACRRCR